MASWEQRWLEAYTHGPVRVLVRDRRRLSEPQLVPCIVHVRPNVWHPGQEEVESYERENQALIQELIEEEERNGAG